ncbi:MAG: undecaprenyl-diphosphatase UppP [Armatimonadota bacterium]
MDILQAIVYGVVEGATEFIPVSSTAHIYLVPYVFGWEKPATEFTAIIQLGAILAVVLYFWSDLSRAATAWVKSLMGGPKDTVEVRTGWAVVIATAIISIVGLALHKYIEGPFRSLWVIGSSLIVMGLIMVLAEKRATQSRGAESVSNRDGVLIGLWQCIALIPGMSRSGSTISGALLGGFDRASAARLSFLMSVPAIALAGAYEGVKEVKHLREANLVVPTLVATVASFAVGYVCIKWLMGFIQKRGVVPFVGYRVALGAFVLVMCATGKWDPNPELNKKSTTEKVTAHRQLQTPDLTQDVSQKIARAR